MKRFLSVLFLATGLLIPVATHANVAVSWLATSTDPGYTQPAPVNGNNPFLKILSVSTSTFQNGINLTTGCFSVGGVCIGSGGGAVSSVFGRTGAVVAQSGDYTTAMVTEVTNLYFTAARVLATTLTGFVSGAGTVSSSDTVLSAIDKLDGNIATKISNITGLITNSTGIGLSGLGTSGNPYSISNTGVTSIVAGTNISISGATGAVTINSTGSSPSGLSTTTPWTAGNLAYVVNNGTVSSVATSTLSASSPLTGSFTQVGTGGALGIQAASASQNGYLSLTDYQLLHTATTTFTSPLIYTTGTNAVTCQTATGSVPGCLSAADWTTFNGKGVGTVMSVSGSGGTTGLTLTGGPITNSGTLTLGGTLAIANGGTNATSFTTSGNSLYWNGTSFLTSPLTSSVSTPYASSTGFSSSYASSTSAFFGNVTLPSLGIPAGQFAAFDPTGKLIGTTTPSGSNSAFSPAVNYATTGALPSNTYVNGTAGVGATITEVGTGALSVDGASPTVGQTVLVKNESSASHNGLYDVTVAGSGIAAFVLTRDPAYNSNTEIIPGIITYVISGMVNADDFWAMTSAAPITVGTTALNYTEVAGGGSNVASVSNLDSTLTISPTMGAVVASLNLAHSNAWTATTSISVNSSATALQVTNIGSNNAIEGDASAAGAGVEGTNSGAGQGGFFNNSSTGNALLTNSGNVILNHLSGFVGIATSTPAYQLSVGTAGTLYGSILSIENKVSTSTSMTIDWSQGNQQLIQIGTSATTIGFSKIISGATLRVVICNPPSSSAGAITWSGVEWPAGTIPTQTTTAAVCDIWSFIATQATSTSAAAFKIFGAMSPDYP